MSDISQILNKILTSVYGKDVRQAIHDGIEACYNDGSAGSTDLTARKQIGTIDNLKTPVKDNLVNAINWIYDNVVHESAVVDSLDDASKEYDDVRVAGIKALNELYNKVKVEKYDVSDLGLQSFWVPYDCEFEKHGSIVYLHVSITTSGIFDPNTKYTLNSVPIPEELRPRGTRTLPSIGCGSNWENARACIVNILPSGYIEICSPVKQAFYKINGSWSVN